MRISDWSSDVCSSDLMAALRKFHEDPVSMSAAMQRNTDHQVEALCELIDAIDGEIVNDWSGETMTKDEAKKYVREYPRTEDRSEEHTSELQSLMRISYAVFCLNKKKISQPNYNHDTI